MTDALVYAFDAEHGLVLGNQIQRCGFDAVTTANVEELSGLLSESQPYACLLVVPSDVDPSTCEALSAISYAACDSLVLLAPEKRFELGRLGMRLGATDMLPLPLSDAAITRILTPAQDESDTSSKDSDRIIGQSEAMKRLKKIIAKVARVDVSVLLVGESGVGKELVAEEIHAQSRRHQKPFEAINCAAIAPNLAESALFGHVKGAFTGADNDHTGVFERANGGTVFLDEISEMDVELQSRLLRVLENNEVRRVGSEDIIPLDIRVVAATNRDPQTAVAENRLRQDIYYRLAEFPISIPPLRERSTDIPVLANFFLDRLCDEFGAIGIRGDALEALQFHDWPGNIRELKNTIAQAAVLADSTITPSDLPQNVSHQPADMGSTTQFRVGQPLKEMERRYILATYHYFDGDKARTAEALSISPKTLYNKLQQYKS